MAIAIALDDNLVGVTPQHCITKSAFRHAARRNSYAAFGS
jgi:hypothetical protein